MTTTDTEIDGFAIPKGTRIHLALGATKHQPDIFAEPQNFDIHRTNSRNNISFRKGNHFCLEAKMARFEAKIALSTLAERIPTLRISQDQQLERIANVSFREPTALTIEW